jgi:hypothetical protein
VVEGKEKWAGWMGKMRGDGGEEMATRAGQRCVREILGTDGEVKGRRAMVGDATIVFECRRSD